MSRWNPTSYDPDDFANRRHIGPSPVEMEEMLKAVGVPSLDALIEARENCDIPTIFAEAGETAFRAIERELIREVAARENVVIATGGGAVVDPQNLAELQRTGTVILLTATPC